MHNVFILRGTEVAICILLVLLFKESRQKETKYG